MSRETQVAVRYLTPHNKWAIHSQYYDNPYMLTLGRGGQTIWMSPADAERIGVRRGRCGCLRVAGCGVRRRPHRDSAQARRPLARSQA